MPSINMIAARRAEKRRLESNRQRLFYVILGEIFLVLAIVSFMVVRLIASEIQSSELSDKLNRLKNRVTEIQHLQDATTALQPKVSALTQATSNTMFWYSALQNVTLSLPASAYLTSVGSAGDPNSGPAPDGSVAKLNIQGQATNQFDVGSAMLRLDCYPNISGVKLHSVSQAAQDANQTPSVLFDMEVELKSQTPAPASEGGANVQKS